MKKYYRLGNAVASCLNYFGLNRKEGTRKIFGGEKNFPVDSVPYRRHLRLEELEDRRLLSASPNGIEELPISSGSTILVTTLADVVNDTDNVISLREAIAQAENGDMIKFDTILNGGTITLSETELTIQRSVTIDASAFSSGITINANQKSRVFYITGGTEETPVNLIGLTITEGMSEYDGGGIYADYSSTVTITNCTISRNSAICGGGIYCYNSSVTITDSKINENTGSGIYSYDTNLTVTGCEISKNVNNVNNGGGIFFQSGFLTVTDCEIFENTGSGIDCWQNTTTVVIKNSKIYGNNNFSGEIGGGGICCEEATLVVMDSEIFGNTASRGGGGITCRSDSATITNCKIYRNTAFIMGGGIYNKSGNLNITNSEIFGNNVSEFGGGGIYSGGNIQITGCNIYGNTTPNGGGGICFGGYLTIINTTISGNTGSERAGGIYGWNSLTITNSIVSQNYAPEGTNIIIDKDCGSEGQFSAESTNNLIDADPGFVVAPVFDSEGKLTNMDSIDLHLSETSLAVNSGNNDYVTTQTDLDGKTRIVNKYVDLGAYESEYDRTPIILDSITLSSYKPVYVAGQEQAIYTTLTPEESLVQYQWYRGKTQNTADMTVITRAIDSSYIYTKDDVGYYLMVKATSNDGVSSVLAVTSKIVREEITGLTFSTNTPVVGEAVTIQSSQDADITYQWYRVLNQFDYTQDVYLASGTAYTPIDADNGYALRVVATGTGNYTGKIMSSTMPVTYPQLEDISISNYTPTIDPQEELTLTTTLDPVNIEVTYQWYRVATDSTETVISGATESSYTVTLDDVGYQLKVVATNVKDTQNTVSSITDFVTALAPWVELIQDQYSVQEGCWTCLTAETIFGENLTYHWTITDGENQFQFETATDYFWVIPEQISLTSGVTYTVELYADGNGFLASPVEKATLKIIETTPTLSLTTAEFASGKILKINLTFQGSNGRTVTNWKINWGDSDQAEEFNRTSNTLTTAHYYTNPGTYSITATTFDSFGKTTNFDVMTYVLPESNPASGNETIQMTVAPVLTETIPEETNSTLFYWNTLPAVETAVLTAPVHQQIDAVETFADFPKAEIQVPVLAAESIFTEEEDWTLDFSFAQKEENSQKTDGIESFLCDDEVAVLL